MATTNLFGELALDATLAAVRDYVASLIGVRDQPAAADLKGVAALVMRGDSDTIGTADGDLSMIRVDEEGRVKVASKTASFPATVGVANAVGEVVIVDVRRASNIVLHVKNVGSVTLAAGTFIFEGSVDSTNGTDGTWFGIQAVRSNANTIETSIALSGVVAAAGYSAAWEASVNACQWVRIRCSVAVTASSSAQWTVQRGSYATEPVPAVPTHNVTSSPVAGSQYSVVTTASTNAAVIKSSAGNLCELTVSNPTATACYVKLYNKTTAPTVGTDVPVLTIPVPATSVAAVPLGPIGKRFATGIGIAVTAGPLATDTAAAVASVQIHGTYV